MITSMNVVRLHDEEFTAFFAPKLPGDVLNVLLSQFILRANNLAVVDAGPVSVMVAGNGAFWLRYPTHLPERSADGVEYTANGVSHLVVCIIATLNSLEDLLCYAPLHAAQAALLRCRLLLCSFVELLDEKQQEQIWNSVITDKPRVCVSPSLVNTFMPKRGF